MSGFCRFGTKTVFWGGEDVGAHLKKETNGETITLKFTNDITKVYRGEFDPYEVKSSRYKMVIKSSLWAGMVNGTDSKKRTNWMPDNLRYR